MHTGVLRSLVVVVGVALTPVGVAVANGHRCADVAAVRQVSVDPGPHIRVIGDSYSEGAWPDELPGTVTADDIGGTGFTDATQPCDGMSFPERAGAAVAAKPDLVIVEGGLNDYAHTSRAVASAARLTLDRLEGVPVMIVGPAPAPARAAEARRVSAVLQRVAESRGVPFVDASHWRLHYLPDDLHLVPASHKVFGARVAEAVADEW